jgi:NAD(P)-dependent dehydrogenase (short-subunit alcohol dehydrogenase family)
VRELFDAVRRAVARLDILVHCAGSMMLRDRVFDTNPRAVLLVTQHARGLMCRGGRLVIVTDGADADPGAFAGATPRDPLETLSRYIAAQVARDGIVVNGVRSSPADGAREDLGDVVATLCLPGASPAGGQLLRAAGPTCPGRR